MSYAHRSLHLTLTPHSLPLCEAAPYALKGRYSRLICAFGTTENYQAEDDFETSYVVVAQDDDLFGSFRDSGI